VLSWLEERLEDGWRLAWRWLSVQLATLSAFAAFAYSMSEYLQLILPAKWFSVVMAVLAVLIIAGRLVKQRDPSPAP